ncbi:uncharacterized protein LOC5522213 [Nematostella vectensis]|uniref:uncharacterized protein LOC5522213 n=1 Tax=Nematostella vectensis TaxID=45351 RepID=UPI002076DA73|nr:uncharacterized protein LOC5522213 [Nematostella vectensis]XP_048578737.1 uncharacterized protein LOC5522213 [Nematostella vectensis]XP_048578738.1 uncharacterized protein LOC5522213 [Nematostella vectensis]
MKLSLLVLLGLCWAVEAAPRTSHSSKGQQIHHDQGSERNFALPLNDDTKKDEPTGKDSKGKISPKGLLGDILGNADLKSAAVDKGIEVAGKLIDKQIDTWMNQTEKASNFLKKKIKLDIMPDKGFQTEDMFAPAGYHISSELDGGDEKEKGDYEPAPIPYPGGFIGNAILNGCFGTNYSQGDPCYSPAETKTQCRNMIDGAAFIGVGFDGRGEYSPESRKMSIIQRDCAGHSSYDGFQVPDTMNVHGIYDTSASMFTFSSRSEYQSFLQREAGVSGSYFGFYAGVKKAWGSSTSTNKQMFLSVFDIDVSRYEIFKDEVKPQDLSQAFLKEFINLPPSYYTPRAPIAYQDFIMRWGTHYIKSATFGGQLELRKLMQGSSTATKTEVAEEMEVEYKSLFWSAGAKYGSRKGTSQRSETKTSSTSLEAQGGSQEIAAILSDMYSPTFKGEFKSWLQSIPDFPKAFKFQMGSVADLVNFRYSDLFPDDEKSDKKGCDDQQNLKYDEIKGKKYFTRNIPNTVEIERVYCVFNSRAQVEQALKDRRQSLMRAIEQYMEEGPISISDFSLPRGGPGCQWNSDKDANAKPDWEGVKAGTKIAQVNFQMEAPLRGIMKKIVDGKDTITGGGVDIPQDMSRLVKRSGDRWYTSEEGGRFHLYDGFAESGTDKISIFGLKLTYDTASGGLTLKDEADCEASKKYFPTACDLKGKQLATLTKPDKELFDKAERAELGLQPCNVQWSNAMRLDPSSQRGKCLHFTAASAGTVYVVFSAIPSDQSTWYYVEISPFAVGIYKAGELKQYTKIVDAVGLGSPVLFQSYAVCIKQTDNSVVIEYGKSDGENTDMYLVMIDDSSTLDVRFYAFGNGDRKAQIADAHVISRLDTKTTRENCKGEDMRYDESGICSLKCHDACDPLYGCSDPGNSPSDTNCHKCRYAKKAESKRRRRALMYKRQTNTGDKKTVACKPSCDSGKTPNKQQICTATKQMKVVKTPVNAAANEVNIGDVDLLKDFTFCIWMSVDSEAPKTPSLKDEDERPAVTVPEAEYNLFKYEQNGRSLLKLTLKRHTDARFLMRLTSDENDNFDFPLKWGNKEWHRFCIGRESPSGKISAFDDKEQLPSQNSLIKEDDMATPATLKLNLNSGMAFDATDINIWDRVLDDEDMNFMYESCGQRAGNVKDWFDIMELIKAKSDQPSKDVNQYKPMSTATENQPTRVSNDFEPTPSEAYDGSGEVTKRSVEEKDGSASGFYDKYQDDDNSENALEDPPNVSFVDNTCAP